MYSRCTRHRGPLDGLAYRYLGKSRFPRPLAFVDAREISAPASGGAATELVSAVAARDERRQRPENLIAELHGARNGNLRQCQDDLETERVPGVSANCVKLFQLFRSWPRRCVNPFANNQNGSRLLLQSSQAFRLLSRGVVYIDLHYLQSTYNRPVGM